MTRDLTIPALAVALIVSLALGVVLPVWLVFLLTIGLAKGLVALGLVVMMRAGLVSFGQGLYYGLGAYAAGLALNFLKITDAIVLIALGGVVTAIVGSLLGLIITRYREIFFAMLSLAVSMILYGILVRSSALGSTDGFNLIAPTLLGFALEGETGRRVLFGLALLTTFIVAVVFHRFVRSPYGVLGEAILSNEIRVEYLGTSVSRVLLVTYTLGAIAGGLGGALVALATGHIDPELAYWTTSGEFVFVSSVFSHGIFACQGRIHAIPPQP